MSKKQGTPDINKDDNRPDFFEENRITGCLPHIVNAAIYVLLTSILITLLSLCLQ